ncbi:MAG: CheB methylesterase domain-containing protein [Thermodesulfobacteriota bacterium]
MLVRRGEVPARARREFLGDILVAECLRVRPVNHHLIVRGDRLVLNDGPKVLNQKPSVDMLFSSAAESYGDRLIGVLLTGMGKDGADGCAAIVSRQGVTLVQDEASSAIFGMPKAAIERGAATRILPLDEIPEHLLRLAGVKHIV